jgi:hypothetical protein
MNRITQNTNCWREYINTEFIEESKIFATLETLLSPLTSELTAIFNEVI